MMVRLLVRNLFRQKLRNLLTIIGVVIAINAFVLLRTVVDAWYSGVDAASAARLITRNAISLTFTLPIAYLDKIRRVEGVAKVSYANWFGGVYIDEKNFFPQFGIQPATYLDLFPEYVLPSEQRKAFIADRRGAIAGQKLVKLYGWKIGDVIPLRGTIFAGDWSFVLRGIYHGADSSTDETVFLFHWDALNERAKVTTPSSADQVGIFITGLKDSRQAALVSKRIDDLFRNSLAETLTETEKAFQLSFVAMTEAIVVAIRIVSFVIIVIIMAVAANTIAMTVREREREYATLKALGFGEGFIVTLIFGEALSVTVIGGIAGVLAAFPMANVLGRKFSTLFPVFLISQDTLMLAAAASVAIGIIAALWPAYQVQRLRIAEALRAIV